MTRTRSRLLATMSLLPVVVGLAVVTAGPAHACSCATEVTDSQAAAGADVVFVGRLDEITEPGGFFGSEDDPATWRFVVDEVFKGEAHAYTDVSSARWSASCGFEVELGDLALVFASVEDGELTGNLCNGTRVLADGQPDLPAPGYAPVAMTVPVDEPGFPALGWLGLVAVAGLGTLPVVLWGRLRSGLVRS